MFDLAAVRWAIWTARNKVCFNKILIKNCYELIFSACLFMCYWAWLFASDDQGMIQAGVETMMKMSTEMLKKNQESQTRSGGH
jgi:hypothetical protein